MARIFISYATEDRAFAEELHYRIVQAGHKTFFDRASIKASDAFDAKIRDQIGRSDLFVFLCSPASVSPGRYTLTELGFAAVKWPNPSGHVLPVLLPDFDPDAMPKYLKGINFLKPEGNALAEIIAVVGDLTRALSRRSARRGLAWAAAAALILIGGIALFLLSRGGQTANPPPPPGFDLRAAPLEAAPAPTGLSREDKLALLFTRSGGQLSAFEQIAGLPLTVTGNYRSYQVDGCDISAMVDNQNNVTWLRLEVSDYCTFNANTLLGNYKLPPLGSMTFGEFYDALGGASFEASCLDSCGNAADPEVYFHWEGPHSENFLELSVVAVDAGDNTGAIAGLRNAIETAEGQDYVIGTKFNCDHKYDTLARQLLGGLRIKAFILGAPQIGSAGACP